LSLQVQVRKEACDNVYGCICGVVVREINSVVKVGYTECGQWDSTTPRPISVTRLLTQYPDDGMEIKVDDTGRKFSVSSLIFSRCGTPFVKSIKLFPNMIWFNLHRIYEGTFHFLGFSIRLSKSSTKEI